MIGFLHVFRFAQDRYLVRIGYQHDTEAAAGNAFTYSGNRLQTGGEVVLPWHNVVVRLDYEMHWRDYKYAQTVFSTMPAISLRDRTRNAICFSDFETASASLDGCAAVSRHLERFEYPDIITQKTSLRRSSPGPTSTACLLAVLITLRLQ